MRAGFDTSGVVVTYDREIGEFAGTGLAKENGENKVLGFVGNKGGGFSLGFGSGLGNW